MSVVPSRSSRGSWLTPRSLRSHLLILVVVVLLPLLLFSTVLTVILARKEQAAVERGMRETARTLAIALDQELRSSITTLEALATSDALATGDLRAFYRQAHRVLQGQHGEWNTILLAEPSGQQVLNLVRPYATPLPRRTTVEAQQRALATGRPAVSDLFSGALLRRPILSVDVPVTNDHGRQYVLAASMDLAAAAHVLTAQPYPADWIGEIFDGKGIIVARTRDRDEWVGKVAPADIVQASSAAPEGWVRATTSEGIPVWTAFHRSAVSGWTVALKIPVASVQGPLHRSLWLIGIAGIVSTLFAMALGALLSRRITRPIAALASSVEALAGGGTPPPLAVSQVDEVDAAARAVARAVQSLQTSERRLRGVLDGLFVFVGLLAPDGTMLEANRVALEAAALGTEDVVGKPAEQAYWWSYSPVAQAELRDAIERAAGGEVARYDTTLRVGADRFTAIDFMLAPMRDPDGRIVSLVASAIDVSERKAMEQAVRHSEARFRQLADAMPQMVWSARPDGYLDYYNRRWYEFTGFPEGQGGDVSWKPILHPDDVDRCVERWYRAVRTGAVFEIEYRFWDRETGAYRWFLGRAVPVRDDDGHIIRWLGTCTDIDVIKRVEEERLDLLARERTARGEAEVANRAKDEFLAVLSHELRTPLTAMLGWVRLLRSGRLTEDRSAHALEVIERNTLMQSQLINDLLDVSRIVAGKLKLERAPLDPAAVVMRAVESLRRDAEAKVIVVETTLDPDAGPVLADPTRLHQVVANLLSNALKFTPSEGRVEIRLVREGPHVVIAVTDTGPGIPPEVLPHIFERFRQGESTSSRRHEGLGLGLAIVHHLVELHGGTVSAENRPGGHGAVFRVALPVLAVRGARPAAGAGVDRDETPAAPSSALDDLRVLVVEDHGDSRELIRAVLDECGARVLVAASVAEAVAQLKGGGFDVLLSDLGMPGADGFDLIRWLRLAEETAGASPLPAIALTAYASADDRERALAAGFQFHVAKPIDPQALIDIVGRAGGRLAGSRV